jgi:hypothetical protein
MNLIKETAVFFLLSLGMGTYAFHYLVPTKLTGVGFFKLVLSITAGCLTVSTIVDMSQNQTSIVIPSIISLFIMAYMYFNHKDERNLTMKLISIILLILFSFMGYLRFTNLHYGFFVITLLLAGIVNYIMVLGHYYLVVPKLTEKPLVTGMKITALFILVKFLVTMYSYFQNQNFFLEGSSFGMGYMFNWIMLSMRVLWGYLALGILTYFGYRLSKMRSTQSATGIFYVMVFFVIVGELIAAYMHFSYGLNI